MIPIRPILRLASAILLGLPALAAGDEATRLAELDRFWAEISRTVHEGDFAGYKATCHPEGVLVSGTKKISQPLAKALERWQQDFTDTKAGKVKATVEFRFSQRLGDDTTAFETGIFLYTAVRPDGQVTKDYVHFEELLVKRDRWQGLMEYQKAKATREEWDALKK